MADAQEKHGESKELRELQVRKLEAISRLRQLRGEMATLNLQLLKAGSSFHEILCW